MKTIIFLGLTTLIFSTVAFSQSYYEEDYPAYEEPMLVDEGSLDSEFQPPLADDYYQTEEIERQEEYPYMDQPDSEWSLQGEEIPVEDYEADY